MSSFAPPGYVPESKPTEVSHVERLIIDSLCIVRSMYADVPNHEPSLMLMNCGDGRLQRPSMGA